MEQWRIEQPQSLDLTGVRRLNVRLVAGSVDVVGTTSGPGGSNGDTGPAGSAHVEVSHVEGPLLVTMEGDTLTITHERLTWGGLFDWGKDRRATAVVSVAVPATCPVELGVVSAGAVVSGITAATKVKSVSGSVTLDDVRADITAQTVSGDLESRGLAGSLQFSTVSGDLTVVDGTSGRVRAETVSGQVTLDLDIPPHSTIDVKSVSGDLTLRLPGSAGLQVSAKTLSGGLDSAFAGLTTERKPGRANMSGQVGSGDGRLNAKTVSGDVTLLQRPSEASTTREALG
jgi:hypothetical protein